MSSRGIKVIIRALVIGQDGDSDSTAIRVCDDGMSSVQTITIALKVDRRTRNISSNR